MTERAKRLGAGTFVTIEGAEGAGKTVQALRLARELTGRGLEVVLTREPGGTSLGERLRTVVLAPGDRAIAPRADALLFNAARAQLVTEVIQPALAAGQVVISARYSDSTVAYQGYGAGVPIDELRNLAAIATTGLVPDVTILLDVDPEIGLARKQPADRTRFEQDFDLPFHQRVRAGFLSIANGEPGRIRVIDANRDENAVFADVVKAADAALPRATMSADDGSPSP
ncbi:MAG TPA: dTMP kinase [Candidatus Limnocylindrales bacterium]|nr:dTMP kinase [Candidatus Limnocylindrales bacterium]